MPPDEHTSATESDSLEGVSRRSVLKTSAVAGIPYFQSFRNGNQHSAPGDGRGKTNSPENVDESHIVPEAQLEAWVAEKAQFNKGMMPPGSRAHEHYVDLLARRVEEVGVDDVAVEEFTFTRWEPTDWSFILNPTSDADPLPVAGYVPYSGTTGPSGRDAPVVHLSGVTASGTTVLLDGAPIGDEIASYDVEDKLVVVDVPLPEIPLSALRDQFYFVSEPIPDTLAPTLFTGLLAVPQIQAALEAHDAAGLIGVLPYGPDGADNLYAPFEGVVADLPGLYLDQFTGRHLKQELAAAGGSILGRLRLEATVDEQATARNVSGVIPSPNDEEIVLCTHTDGTNANEDNGPAAVLALAEYFQQLPRGRRPATIRVVLTGGHFAHNNSGLRAYLNEHADEVEDDLKAAIELEHLGALEWDEQTDGSFELTGRAGLQLLPTTSSRAVVEESIRFGEQFDRLFVPPSEILYFGAGDQWLETTELIQYITGENYLLSYGFPDEVVTTDFHDYALMREQIAAFAQMVLNLANKPTEAFAEPYQQ